MSNWFWFLLFEDTLFLSAILFLLYLRQMPYMVGGGILFIVILLTNILIFRGYRNVFIALLPALTVLALSLFGRPYLPPPRIPLGTRMMWLLLLILLVLMTIIGLFFAIKSI